MTQIAPRPTTFIEPTALIPRSEFRVVLATETFQYTGSFKFRAAYQVARFAPQGHIIAASSGNFGQALALACGVFGKRCTVVMPSTSAQVKIDAVRSHGATVDLIDTAVTHRDKRVAELAAQYPDAYITSAFDDPWVIAGNATLGAEILGKYADVEAIVAPLGGGGLTSGIVTAVRETNRHVKVYGAEPELGNDGAKSFRAGKLVANEGEPATIADGARTLSMGRRNWEILSAHNGLKGVLEVSEQAICDAVRSLFFKANLKAEPTGALAVGAVLSHSQTFMTGGTVCCVVSGANVDPAVYAQIITG